MPRTRPLHHLMWRCGAFPLFTLNIPKQPANYEALSILWLVEPPPILGR